jgi:hypothetical protein
MSIAQSPLTAKAWIVETLGADESLQALAPGGVWDTLAPQDAVDADEAFIAFQLIGSAPEHTLSQASHEVIRMQVKIVSSNHGIAEGARARIRELLDNASPTPRSVCLLAGSFELTTLADSGVRHERGDDYRILVG